MEETKPSAPLLYPNISEAAVRGSPPSQNNTSMIKS